MLLDLWLIKLWQEPFWDLLKGSNEHDFYGLNFFGGRIFWRETIASFTEVKRIESVSGSY